MSSRCSMFIGISLMLAASFVGPGCGEEASDDDPRLDAGTGSDASVPFDVGVVIDTGGNGGDDGDDGDTGDAMMPPFDTVEPSTIDCGTGTCTSLPVTLAGMPINQIPPCCIDAETVTCGYDFYNDPFRDGDSENPVYYAPEGCFELEQPGSPDDACPSRTFYIETADPQDVPVAGCCLPNDKCGVRMDLRVVSAGVVSFSVGDLGCLDPTGWIDDYNPAEDEVKCVYVPEGDEDDGEEA